MTNFTPEKCKQIALARLDIVHKWLEFRKQSQNKLQADYDFVNLHNTSNSHLFEILGKISRGSLHRWYAMLISTEDYTKLLPQYKYSTVREYRTVLNDDEIKIFMGLLLHPNRLSIGKAIALTKYKLKEQGQSFIPADITFRRYAKWFKDNNYDKWILARDGEKALSDKVEPYIKRDASLLEVGDILVADGHKLAFQVINPFTGKPCRATLVGFLDWKSTALVGYEIMLEENTQCIASALRNAIINLDMIPKIVYQDNGRAFRAKYFTCGSGSDGSKRKRGVSVREPNSFSYDKGFTELGFQGLYSKLGIEVIFIDEVDYLMNNYKTIETLRDIQDETGCPLIFIGMGLAHRKLERYQHLYDRFSEILKFEVFTPNDINQIITQLSEVPFNPEAIEYIHTKYNRFRQIVQLINQIETIAKDNNFTEITKELAEQII